MSLSGCHKAPPPITKLSQAHQKFEKICSQDLSLRVTTTIFPNTLYIYIPLDSDILQTRASRPNPFENPAPSPKRQINFVKTKIADGKIQVDYDITPLTSYPKDLGYQSTYTEKFSSVHSNVLQALNQSYGNLTGNQKPMDFVVLFIVDIHNGIAIKNTFYLKDLQMVMAQALSQDEYIKRYISDMIGNQKFINNPTGRGLKFHDITWAEFLAKQITYRINFKYTRSSFPPKKSDPQEILSIIHNTVHAYNFNGFKTVELKNLVDGTTKTFGKDDVENLNTDPGHIIHIKFQYAPTPSQKK